jgi:hypothetical protein
MTSLVTHNQKDPGVGPPSDQPLSPRQQRFISYYLDTSSKSFGNCYQSAIRAGFSDMTARNLTHNKPKWYSEIIGQSFGAQPEHLLLKLTEIISSHTETTANKLRAIDMLMRCYSMYKSTVQQNIHFKNINVHNIQNVLD